MSTVINPTLSLEGRRVPFILSLIVGLLIQCCLMTQASDEGTVVDNFLDAIDKGKLKRTLADMRTLATAIESYGIDHELMPPTAPVESLIPLLSPTYIGKAPMKDAWGYKFRYTSWQEDILSLGADHFLITSPGKGGAWETDDPGSYTAGATVDMTADLVFAVYRISAGKSKREFIRAPEWFLQNQREWESQRQVLMSAVLINSIPLLEYEVNWAEREWQIINIPREYANQLPEELDGMRISNQRFDDIIPPAPQVGSYLKNLAQIAKHLKLSFHTSEPRIVQHDRYQEIIIDFDVQDYRDALDYFPDVINRRARLSSSTEPQIVDSTLSFSLSLFAVPVVENIEIRSCRPIDASALPSTNQEIEQLKIRLASSCTKLEKYSEMRTVYQEYKALKSRLELMLNLVRVHHPSE